MPQCFLIETSLLGAAIFCPSAPLPPLVIRNFQGTGQLSYFYRPVVCLAYLRWFLCFLGYESGPYLFPIRYVSFLHFV